MEGILLVITSTVDASVAARASRMARARARHAGLPPAQRARDGGHRQRRMDSLLSMGRLLFVIAAVAAARTLFKIAVGDILEGLGTAGVCTVAQHAAAHGDALHECFLEGVAVGVADRQQGEADVARQRSRTVQTGHGPAAFAGG
jgi:hypothetical protein